MSSFLRLAAVGGVLVLAVVLASVALSPVFAQYPSEEGKNYVVYYAYNPQSKILWKDGQVLRKIATSPDSKLVAAIQVNQKARRTALVVYDAETGKTIANMTSLDIEEASGVRINLNTVKRIIFLNDTHLLLVGSQQIRGKVYRAVILSIKDKTVEPIHPQPAVRINPAAYEEVFFLGVEPHSLRAAYVKIAYGKQPVVYIKDPSNKTIAETVLEDIAPKSYPKARGRWSPDGSKLAIVLIDPKNKVIVLVVLDKNGEKLWARSFPGRKEIPGWQLVAWSPDTKTIIYQNQTAMGTVLVGIESKTGEIMWETSLGTYTQHLLARGGKLLAVYGDGAIVVSLKTGRKIGEIYLRPRGVDAVAIVNETIVALRGGKGILVVEKIPEIGVISVEYTSGPPITICIKPEQSNALKTPLCGRKEQVPWFFRAVLPPGKYTIEVPARSLVDAITKIGGEIPGIGKLEITDLLKAYLEATNKIPLASIEVKDLDWVKYKTSLKEILEKNLALIEIKGPPSTQIKIIELKTGWKGAARIPVTGKALLILPPGTYRIEYKAPSQNTYTTLVPETRLEPGAHKTLEIKAQQETQTKTETETKTTQQATRTKTTKTTTTTTEATQKPTTLVKTSKTTSSQSSTRVQKPAKQGESQPSSLWLYAGIGVVVLAVLVAIAMRRKK